VKPGAPPADAFAARRAAIAAIEKESTDATGLRSDVVTLYQGGLYHLYRYKSTRTCGWCSLPSTASRSLAATPTTSPTRYNLDISLFRVYENDTPARIEHYLTWSPGGARMVRSCSPRGTRVAPSGSTPCRTSSSCATPSCR